MVSRDAAVTTGKDSSEQKIVNTMPARREVLNVGKTKPLSALSVSLDDGSYLKLVTV